MKLTLRITLILLLILSQCNDSIKPKIKKPMDLLKINVNFFKGKTVKTLLEYIPYNYLDYLYLQDPVGLLQGCEFLYQGNILLSVYLNINELKYLKHFSDTLDWDIEKFKQEIIYEAKIEKINYKWR
ncbi:MAG: hypothetical protein IEMM0008_0758 [bacterium]|nr:MAG: hypothetical protein IEMM0008_0758 [bacterium]